MTDPRKWSVKGLRGYSLGTFLLGVVSIVVEFTGILTVQAHAPHHSYLMAALLLCNAWVAERIACEREVRQRERH